MWPGRCIDRATTDPQGGAPSLPHPTHTEATMTDDPTPTDDPAIVLLALRIVDATRLDDQSALRRALLDAIESRQTASVLRSIAALAAELVRALPDADERMARWLLATDLEIPARDTPPDANASTPDRR
ncbi:hypothetical protein OVA14_10565 [Agrococcus sp. SL85]|uniref:hypothetical protein n=1 Tax=Agrococcus sp. SL85 TaxID=2995141 RepID=UPI00226C6FD4|nr:hypothetical protein [Agrococcus sp. SL85]WAC65760.1 hypothetical protein OVA14_10565 [Agrococcus sp. SL85]